jgi:hypothetical protein
MDREGVGLMEEQRVTVIDLDFWGEEYLLSEKGRRCCLGFNGRDYGVPDDCMRHHGYPHDIVCESEFEEYVSAWSALAPKELIHTTVEAVEKLRKDTDLPLGSPYIAEDIFYCVAALAAFVNDNWRTWGLTPQEAIELLKPIFNHVGWGIRLKDGSEEAE